MVATTYLVLKEQIDIFNICIGLPLFLHKAYISIFAYIRKLLLYKKWVCLIYLQNLIYFIKRSSILRNTSSHEHLQQRNQPVRSCRIDNTAKTRRMIVRLPKALRLHTQTHWTLHIPTPPHMHTQTHTNIQTLTHTHTHTHIHTRTHTHTYIYIYTTHKLTHTQAPTNTTFTHTHTHTHTNTHTELSFSSSVRLYPT